MGFSDQQLRRLRGKLDPKRIKSREQAGRELPFIEGWYAMAQANLIFGYEGWDRVTLSHQLVFERNEGGRTRCAYLARVRIIVRAGATPVIREGSGFGTGDDLDAGQAHELALKTAETDATKRALATFGNRFGLGLYDKTQAVPPPPKFKNGTGGPGGGRPEPNGTDVSDDRRPASLSNGHGLQKEPNADATNAAAGPTQTGASSPLPNASRILPGVASMQARWVGVDGTAMAASSGASAALQPAAPFGEEERPRSARAIKEALLFFKRLRLHLLRASTLAGVEHLIAGVAEEVERLKHLHPDLRNSRGQHHGDLIYSIADLRRAELSGQERPLTTAPGVATRIEKSKLALGIAKRHRDRQHLKNVAAEPCLVCGRNPAHAHHLKFAQAKGLGIKVSDEFTVPLCAIHHDALHRAGDEWRWWHGHNIDPLPVALDLWQRSRGLELRPASDVATDATGATDAAIQSAPSSAPLQSGP